MLNELDGIPPMSDVLYIPIAQEIYAITAKLLATRNRPLTEEQHLFIATIHQQADRFCKLVEKFQSELTEMRTGKAYHSVGHDLLTPLVSVIGYAEILKAGVGGELGETDHEYVLQILEKGYRLRDNINALIKSAKIKAGLLKDTDLSEWDIT